MKNFRDNVVVIALVGALIAIFWYLQQKPRPRLGAALIQRMGPRWFAWVDAGQIEKVNE